MVIWFINSFHIGSFDIKILTQFFGEGRDWLGVVPESCPLHAHGRWVLKDTAVPQEGPRNLSSWIIAVSEHHAEHRYGSARSISPFTRKRGRLTPRPLPLLLFLFLIIFNKFISVQHTPCIINRKLFAIASLLIVFFLFWLHLLIQQSTEYRRIDSYLGTGYTYSDCLLRFPF